jgi:hypothetical protein
LNTLSNRGGHFEPENRNEPNNSNFRSIQVLRFEFGSDKFIIRSSGPDLVTVV